MAYNYYRGWTEAQLLDERRQLQEQLAGRISSMGGGVPTGMRFERTVEVALKRVEYALYELAPAKYVNPYLADIRSTMPAYTWR